MEELRSQLTSLHPTISKLLADSSSPGLSIGVLHKGNVVHTAHFGRRDAFDSAPPNDETLYHVASLTKLMTAGVVAHLVNSGTLSWDTPIREYLPTFRRRTDDIGRMANLRDLLSNRTGIAIATAYWGQQAGEFVTPKSEIVNIACDLDAVKPFRKAFVYSNFNYGLITEVVETVTQKPFSRCVNEIILKPLGMQRTTLNPPSVDNVARVHGIHDDGSPCKMPFAQWSDDTGFGAGAGGRSSIKELLLMYKSILSAYNHQVRNQTDSTPESPFRHLRTVLAPHVKVTNEASVDRQAYCLGAYRSQLPSNLSIASINNFLLSKRKRDLIGTSSPGLEIFHHTATFPGYLASMFLIPSTESAVVALTNSLPLFDPTDFAAQLVVSILLGEEPPRHFIKLGRSLRGSTIAAYGMLAAHLESQKTDIPPLFPLQVYKGDYYNRAGNFFYRVSVRGRGLRMRVQGLPLTTYDLMPYDGDTFYWPPNREEELCKKGMFLFLYSGWHKVTFRSSVEGGNIDQMIWHHDSSARPETFLKRGTTTPARL
jgi:CubicO group peptidase (beta-lactamase class C family)